MQHIDFHLEVYKLHSSDLDSAMHWTGLEKKVAVNESLGILLFHLEVYKLHSSHLDFVKHWTGLEKKVAVNESQGILLIHLEVYMLHSSHLDSVKPWKGLEKKVAVNESLGILSIHLKVYKRHFLCFGSAKHLRGLVRKIVAVVGLLWIQQEVYMKHSGAEDFQLHLQALEKSVHLLPDYHILMTHQASDKWHHGVGGCAMHQTEKEIS